MPATTSARPETPHSPDAHRCEPPVLPLVRRARLLRLEPSPSKEEARGIQDSLKDAWGEAQAAYRLMVAGSVGLPEESLEFVATEWVRFHLDGKTPMVDFPRLKTVPGASLSLDTRICIAICTDNLSSKIWSRVGLPLTGSRQESIHDQQLCGDNELRKLAATFRKLADDSSSWAAQLFRDSLTALSGHRRVVDRGVLEVSAVTVGDECLRSGLEKLANTEISAADLLASCEFGPALSEYLASLADLPKLSRLKSQDDPESFWFSTTGTVELPDGHLEPRPMLFWMRPDGEVAQAIGVGFDDSVNGQLVQRSALTVSRWVANRV